MANVMDAHFANGLKNMETIIVASKVVGKIANM